MAHVPPGGCTKDVNRHVSVAGRAQVKPFRPPGALGDIASSHGFLRVPLIAYNQQAADDSPRHKQEDLRTAYSHLTQEMRFLKEHQWRTAYYALLVDGAAIGLFQIDMSLPAWAMTAVQILGTLVVVGIAAVQVLIQAGHARGMIKVRQSLDYVGSPLGLGEKQTIRPRSRRDLLYAWMFCAVIILAAVLTGTVIWFG